MNQNGWPPLLYIVFSCVVLHVLFVFLEATCFDFVQCYYSVQYGFQIFVLHCDYFGIRVIYCLEEFVSLYDVMFCHVRPVWPRG